MIQTITVTNNGITRVVIFTLNTDNSNVMTISEARQYLVGTVIDPKIIGFLKGKIVFTKSNLLNLITAFSEETVSNTTNKSEGFNMKETLTSAFNTAATFIKSVSTEVYEYAKANKLFTGLMVLGYGLVFCATPVPMILTLASGLTVQVMVMTMSSYLYITLALLAFSTAAIIK